MFTPSHSPIVFFFFSSRLFQRFLSTRFHHINSKVESGQGHELVSLPPAKDSPDPRSAHLDIPPSTPLLSLILLSNMFSSLLLFPSILISHSIHEPISLLHSLYQENRPPRQHHSSRPFQEFWYLFTLSLKFILYLLYLPHPSSLSINLYPLQYYPPTPPIPCQFGISDLL